jgi:hypothetical protein
MIFISMMLGMIAGVVGILFPPLGPVFFVAGVVTIVFVGTKILPQGDSNEKES